jgi:hypothetical protein
MVNRFKNRKAIDVKSLWISLPVALAFYGVLFMVIGASAYAWYAVSNSTASASSGVRISTIADMESSGISVMSTNTPFPTSTLSPSPTSFPTNTPMPTSTLMPTNTPFPTSTPLPTSTPFALTILYPETPVPPRRSYSELQSGRYDLPDVHSEYAYGYYDAFCQPIGLYRIEPRVVGVGSVPGLHWDIWNDFGWSAELEFTPDVTFFMSEEPSTFHLALFFYEEQLSDEVLIDFPGDCPYLQVVFIQSVPDVVQSGVRVTGVDIVSSTLPVTTTGVVVK